MAELKRVRTGFNLLAPVYDFIAAAASLNYIHRSQTALLPLPGQYSNALVFGGGTGKFLLELMKNNTAVHYCYADISDKMIEATRKRLLSEKMPEPVELICGSYSDIPDGKFDLIITNYILDCFSENELPVVLDNLNEKLSPGGTWLFVDFNIPNSNGYRFFSRMATRLLYMAFNILCGLGVNRLPDFSAAFAQRGYKPVHEKYFLGGLLVARIYKGSEQVP